MCVFYSREHIEGYREKCPELVNELVTEVDGLIEHLQQALLEQLRAETEVGSFGCWSYSILSVCMYCYTFDRNAAK